MARDTERDALPDLSRREILASLGVGGLSVPGLMTALEPEAMVGLPRGEGAPVSVERAITDDAVEYRPVSDTVRWSRSTDRTGPYTTEPFERWATRRSASVGSEVVLPTIQNRVDEEVTGIGKAASREIIGMVITVHVGTTYDRDGDVVSEPNVSTEEVVDVTPRSVRTTMVLEGQEYTRSVPVFVEETDFHYD